MATSVDESGLPHLDTNDVDSTWTTWRRPTTASTRATITTPDMTRLSATGGPFRSHTAWQEPTEMARARSGTR